MNFLSILVLVLLAGPPGALAQVGLLGTDPSGSGLPISPRVAELAPRSIDPATIFPGLPAVLAKLRAASSKLQAKQPLSDADLLTPLEFLVYLRGIEAHPSNLAWFDSSLQATRGATFPARPWAMVVTALHDQYYAADRKLILAGVDLFLDGTENQGWEDVDFFGLLPPKFIFDPNARQRIDISHAYAGVAALVQRDGLFGVNARLMGHVNTGVGDSTQVASARITGASRYVLGALCLDGANMDAGSTEFQGAARFKPADQELGNRVGNEARAFLQSERRNVPLSMAFREAFHAVGVSLRVIRLPAAQ